MLGIPCEWLEIDEGDPTPHYSGNEEYVAIRSDVFIRDILEFAHPRRVEEARRTIRSWLEEDPNFELTPDHFRIIASWENKDPGEKRRYIRTAVRRYVLERDKHRCVECGATDRLSLDHIKPFSRGGMHTPSNLRVLCTPCNSRKGARPLRKKR